MFEKGYVPTPEHRAKQSAAKMGDKNPMRGKNFSEKHRKKLSIALKGNKNGVGGKSRLGQKLTSEHRAKLSKNHADHSGKNHYNYGKRGKFASGWKPDENCVTPIHKRIRNSDEYKDWRNSVFERDGWICQKCNGKVKDLNAHHIKSFSEFPELRFDPSNGVTYCEGCHTREHIDIKRSATQ